MSEVWVLVGLTGASAVLLKSAGPVLLGGRALPERLGGVVALLAPALLAALIATQTLADGKALVVDERVAGLGAAAAALWLRAPVLVAVVVAALVTGGLRAIG